MITRELDDVFVASVRIMQLLTMVRSDKLVLLARREHGRNEALFNVCDRRQLVQIKDSLVCGCVLCGCSLCVC